MTLQDSELASGSSPDTKLVAVAKKVFTRPVAKALPSYAFQIAEERAIRKFLTNPYDVND